MADRAFALVLVALALSVVAAIVTPGAELVAGAFAALATAFGLVNATSKQRVIAFVLLGVGIATLVIGLLLGAAPTLPQYLAVNQDITGMLAATSFVGIIAVGAQPGPPRLRGAAAVWRTGAVVHFLGSIINMSAVSIIADHLRKDGKLSSADAVLLTRTYMTAAFWSPFWAASAAVLLLEPQASVVGILLIGMALALVSLAIGMPSLVRQYGPDLADYHGYALSWTLLRLPVALVVAAVTSHLIAPTTPVPRLVTLSALVVTGLALLLKDRSTAPAVLWRHTLEGLPLMRGEITLFTSAGVLSIGLGALISRLPISLPVATFDVPLAWLCVLVMAALSLVGVHQLISLGVIATLVLPLEPQPTLFAMAAVIGWGLASIIGPLSGLQLYLSSRYGISALMTSRRNLLFAVLVLALAWPVLLAVNALGV